MIRTLFTTAFVVIVVTIGLGVYLQPNDFVGCQSKPDSSASSHCHAADAIVAISGGDTAARADQAIRLYQDGWGKKLIFSGAAKDKSGPSNAAVMEDLALKAGVSADDIIIEEYSATTAENAANLKEIFGTNGINSIILVTSGYHQRRASLEFGKYTTGVKIYNWPLASDSDWSSMFWWLNPRGWWLAVSEIVKIVIFYVSGASL